MSNKTSTKIRISKITEKKYSGKMDFKTQGVPLYYPTKGGDELRRSF